MTPINLLDLYETSVSPFTYSTEKLPPKTVVVFFVKDVGQFFKKI